MVVSDNYFQALVDDVQMRFDDPRIQKMFERCGVDIDTVDQVFDKLLIIGLDEQKFNGFLTDHSQIFGAAIRAAVVSDLTAKGVKLWSDKANHIKIMAGEDTDRLCNEARAIMRGDNDGDLQAALIKLDTWSVNITTTVNSSRMDVRRDLRRELLDNHPLIVPEDRNNLIDEIASIAEPHRSILVIPNAVNAANIKIQQVHNEVAQYNRSQAMDGVVHIAARRSTPDP